ncbi:hypothetical protein [Nostoc piscinale]|uniref:hypothetical protein n=1 Tax=Nostoc piscinale TaxID=224012 RepID=UPI0039A48730
MRYISTPPPTPPRLRGGERLRQQMRGGVPTVLQASQNRYSALDLEKLTADGRGYRRDSGFPEGTRMKSVF